MAYIVVITCPVLWICVAKVTLFSQNAKFLLLFYQRNLQFVVLEGVSSIVLTFHQAIPRHRDPYYRQ